jgi:hypothetical protein
LNTPTVNKNDSKLGNPLKVLKQIYEFKDQGSGFRYALSAGSEAPRSPFQEVSSKSILKSRESPKSPKFYHFGNDFRAGENRNHFNRISTSSRREKIFEEVFGKHRSK